MRTVVLSDTHLGTTSGRDLLRHPGTRANLADRIRGADHVVLLGDVVEFREAPLAAALGASEPFFRELGAALGDGTVTLVPGNHDYRLGTSLIEGYRLDDGAGLGVDRIASPPASGPVARIAGWLRPAELRVAYPGVWVRPDVYAMHGHYLDCHLTIPTLERLGIALTQRAIGGPSDGRWTPDDYEAAVQPLYALTYSLAQSSRGRRLIGGGRSVNAWQQLSGTDRRRRLATLALGGVVLPGAVAVLNRAGFGPLTANLTGSSLRSAGLRAMADVVRNLEIDARHVLFGHTHRSGPWPRDRADEWRLPGDGSLLNTGSWFHEPAFLGAEPLESPYWPGTCVMVDDAGPPRLERLLDRLPTGT